MTDLLIRDIDVVGHGTGAPGYRADVLVDNGRITEISPRTVSGADKTIDPGPGTCSHQDSLTCAHSDLRLLTDPGHFPEISQGVTAVIGQDAVAAPIADAALRPSAGLPESDR